MFTFYSVACNVSAQPVLVTQQVWRPRSKHQSGLRFVGGGLGPHPVAVALDHALDDGEPYAGALVLRGTVQALPISVANPGPVLGQVPKRPRSSVDANTCRV